MRKLPLVISLVLVSIIFGSLYGVVQQTLRQSANDPQIQIALDMAAALDEGQEPADFDDTRVNIAQSLTPFTIIYGKDGKPVAGTGYLDSSLPTVPYGVLMSAQYEDYNAVTWQPRGGTRIASVAVAANNYYVVSGRSLKEIELRADHALKLVLSGWFLTVLVLVGAYAFRKYTVSRVGKQPAK